MIEISTDLVKKLRKLTGLGVMHCKESLRRTNGDIELAIEDMRKSGAIKAAKKSNITSDNGVVITKIKNDYGFILEVNCQTDFVSRDLEFLTFVNTVLDTIIFEKITDMETIQSRFKEERIKLINKTGENIIIRRMAFLHGSNLGCYQHGVRIGVLISANNADESLLKKVAMHIAASKPEFVKPENIPSKVLEREHRIQMEIARQSGKPKQVAEKIVQGRMNKFLNEISLTGQTFVIDSNKTVDQLLKEHGSEVIDFIRFEIGEHLETG